MRGNLMRFPLIGALNGRCAAALLSTANAAGFAHLLSLPGDWTLLRGHS
jgi:hypothetical protein